MLNKYKTLSVVLKLALIASLILIFQAIGVSEEIDAPANLDTSLKKEQHLKEIKKFIRSGRYESAITEAKALVQVDPDDELGHVKLRAIYTLLGRYSDALEENITVIGIKKNKNSAVCADIEVHAMILEFDNRQQQAIDFLEGYRKSCPKTVKRSVYGLQEARSRNEKYFPSLSHLLESQSQN